VRNSYTLAIEGATYLGSVAILRGAEVVAEKILGEEDGSVPRAGKGERLMPAIAASVAEVGLSAHEISRIVCGSGPGSFTSLRVAGSVAKGLAAGYGVDLYAVSSLLLTATGVEPPLPSGEYLSVIDAMRGEFYSARITIRQSLTTQADPPTILSRSQLDEIAQGNSLKLIGPGQQIDAHPHARGVASLLDSILETGPVDLASWEPDYGRLAEAQVRWEATHGRKLTT
jgi:tRNA threonylcarbamoyladenosine biosynthesis protein TsaB